MKEMRTLIIMGIAFVSLLPEPASAVTLVQVFGVFHLFVGLFVTATFFVFVTGVFVYFSRLGTWPTHRDTAIEVMEWGIVMMFVLLVILGLVKFFQHHSAVALLLLGFIVIVAVAFFLIRAAAGGGEKKKPVAPPRAGGSSRPRK